MTVISLEERDYRGPKRDTLASGLTRLIIKETQQSSRGWEQSGQLLLRPVKWVVGPMQPPSSFYHVPAKKASLTGYLVAWG